MYRTSKDSTEDEESEADQLPTYRSERLIDGQFPVALLGVLMLRWCLGAKADGVFCPLAAQKMRAFVKCYKP